MTRNLITLDVRTRAEWRQWLAEHHASSPGIWLVRHKQHAGVKSMPYEDLVCEALCFGWIDSRRWRLDDTFFLQIFTPRKGKSRWSGLNKKRVAALIDAGLMAPAGHAAIEVAKKNGMWTHLDHVESLVMPPDFVAALAKNAKARAYFDASSPWTQKVCLYRLNGAKRPETRERYIKQLIDALKTGKNPFRMQTKKPS